jgi:hypothetical protein
MSLHFQWVWVVFKNFGGGEGNINSFESIILWWQEVLHMIDYMSWLVYVMHNIFLVLQSKCCVCKCPVPDSPNQHDNGYCEEQMWVMGTTKWAWLYNMLYINKYFIELITDLSICYSWLFLIMKCSVEINSCIPVEMCCKVAYFQEHGVVICSFPCNVQRYNSFLLVFS